MFNKLSSAGLDILKFARDTAESVVNTFLSDIGIIAPALRDTALGGYSLLELMCGVGLPLYILYTAVKYIVGIIS